MPAWLSKACHDSATGEQDARGLPFNGNASMLWACRSFDPVCQENASQPWYRLPDPTTPRGVKSPVRSGDVEGRCSGDWTGGTIVDVVQIPADLPTGDYVIGR
eukprot:COSAG01_NODE_16425_length_1237_cov_1.265378_3_plen_103_part_00